MRKISYNAPIPAPTVSLLQDFADVKLINRLSELGDHPTDAIFKVGTEDGRVENPFHPGFIYMRAIYPDGTSSLTECYVPTYVDGSTQVLFEPDQIITPKRSTDTNPTHWVYDGLPPTPKTRIMYLADAFDPSIASPSAFDAAGNLVDDSSLPNVISVDRMKDGSTTPLTWTMTDTGATHPTTGERLWNVKYTGPDYNPATVNNVGYFQTQADGSRLYMTPPVTQPVPPTNEPLLAKLFDPCNPDECTPDMANYPTCDPAIPGRPTGALPVYKPIPPIPVKDKQCPVGFKKDASGNCVKTPDPLKPNKPKIPLDGFRLPPNSPKRPIPPTRPYVPPPPSSHPTSPPTGPGVPPPPGDPTGPGGGTWVDDGTHIRGCFGIPILLDSQIVTTNDTSNPSANSTQLNRDYYNIRNQIDAAIARLIGPGKYRAKGLISVTLMFDGINDEQEIRTIVGEAEPEVTTNSWYVPRVYRTVVIGSTAENHPSYFSGPTSLFNNDAITLPYQTSHVDIPPDAAIDIHYRIWEFDAITVGGDSDPIRCDPLHYSYRMNTLPAYNSGLYAFVADRPGYRLYLSCFKIEKDTSASRMLPYHHNFADGQDGWSGSYDGSLGVIYEVGVDSPGPFIYGSWIVGWTVTITGWNDAADDLFGHTTLSNGKMDVWVFIDHRGIGQDIAHGSKNMYGPLNGHGDEPRTHPYTFTWSFNNYGNAVLSPCTEYYFSVYGGVYYGPLTIKEITITPIIGQQPQPPATPPPTGPGVLGGSVPTLPVNGGTSPIPKGTPLGPPSVPTSGDDGNGLPKIGPAYGGNPPSPAIGVAPDIIPVNGSVDPKTQGQQSGYSGLTPGLPVYVDPAVAGGVTQTKPTCSGCIEQSIGTALDATTIDIDIGPAIKRI